MKNMEKKIKLEDAKRRYKKFFKDNDFRDVKEYFEIGLEAEVFTDKFGNIFNKNDDLMFGFFVDMYGNILLDSKDSHKAIYQYTFRRQPVIQQKQKIEDPKEQLLQQFKSQGFY